MKLIDLLKNWEDVDEELIIFQENETDFNADIILAYGEVGDGGIKIENGRKYTYLIEVFLAKEFVGEWVDSLTFKPGYNEIAKRLHEYARNDA